MILLIKGHNILSTEKKIQDFGRPSTQSIIRVSAHKIKLNDLLRGENQNHHPILV